MSWKCYVAFYRMYMKVMNVAWLNIEASIS